LVSSLDTLNLAVGTSDFTCCQRNHTFGDRIVPCDRGITRTILEGMIDAKVQYFFNLKHTFRARLCRCLANWWLRTKSIPEENCSDSLASFKTFLKWTEHDDEWIDQDEVPILWYAVLWNDINVVREILKSSKPKLNETLFENGVVEFGISARVTILLGSMCFASVKIVQMLLENGANPFAADRNGMDSLMLACMLGRAQNIKFWISQFQNWDINRGNNLNGSTALHCAIYFGQNKMKTVQALMESGRVSLDVQNNGGASVLSNAVSSTDSNVDVVRYLLSRKLKYGVNHRRVAQTKKWKLIYGIAKGLSRVGVTTSGLFAQLASDSGSTPLQYAVRRGDLEVVELLMQHGAKASSKNDLGRDILSYCEAFPEIKGAIERLQRERKRVQQKNKKSSSSKSDITSSRAVSSNNSFTLQRRLSTATLSTYDMYLINLNTMMKHFGSISERKKNLHLCHQKLLEKDDLIRFEDLPMGTFTMFISHEWLSRDHPDPSGVQLSTLCHVLRELRDGKIERVGMDIVHRLTYKHNFSTSAKEWSGLLTNAYVWFDWWSQPQPSMEKFGTPERTKCEKDLAKALRSTVTYVSLEGKASRHFFFVILSFLSSVR